MGTENVLGNLNATVLSEDGVAISEKYASKDDVMIETEVKVFTNNWSDKTWNGLTSLDGNKVWTDGENVYYSSGSDQYVLDKSTSTWSTKTWKGNTNFFASDVWTDGENIYYSYSSEHYVLNKATSTWSRKTWTGLTSFRVKFIWTDGENVYYSSGTSQYVLDKSTSTWSSKAWFGLTDFNGNRIWTDDENIYYSNGSDQYVLDKATSTWSTKTWIGFTEPYSMYIWTDGENIYHSYSNSSQYVLDKTTSTWSKKTWTGLTRFFGQYVWTDGDNVYYSDNSGQTVGSSQCVLDKKNATEPIKEYVQEIPKLPPVDAADKALVSTGVDSYEWRELADVDATTLFKHTVTLKTEYDGQYAYLTFSVYDDESNAYTKASLVARYRGKSFASTGNVAGSTLVDSSSHITGIMRFTVGEENASWVGVNSSYAEWTFWVESVDADIVSRVGSVQITTEVDSAMSTTSENPLQNKVITSKINEIDSLIERVYVSSVTIASGDDLDSVEPNLLAVMRAHRPVIFNGVRCEYQTEENGVVQYLTSKLNGSLIHLNLISVDSSGIIEFHQQDVGDAQMAQSVAYVTTAPTGPNTEGLKFAVLTAEPTTEYDGWFYIITGAQA